MAEGRFLKNISMLSKRLSITLITSFIFLALLYSPATALADTDYTADDNCPNITLDSTKYQLGDITPIDNYTSSTVSKAFSITRVPPGTCDDGVYDATACASYCDNVSDNSIYFCYDTSTTPATTTCPNSKLYKLNPSQDVLINESWFQATLVGNTICVQVFSRDGTGWITLGCKQSSASTTTQEQSASECYVDQSCANTAMGHTKTFFSPSSLVVECIKETLAHVFIDSKGCPGRTNLFTNFQRAMKKTVGAALILYVIFYAMKIVVEEHAPSKGELFWFALKMAMVIYFSIGNGVQSFLYPVFVDSMLSISQMMFDAGNVAYDSAGNVVDRGLCTFKSMDYPKDYRYIALFDSIDCRVGSYLLLSNKSVPMFILMIFPMLFSGQIFMCIFCMLFGIFMLSIMVFVVHSFIISLIILTLVMYFAPLFVPLALFSYTKKYYQNWIKSLLFGVLQPLVLFACVALMLTIFDQMYYGDCRFTRQSGALGSYKIDDSISPDSCKDAMGYKLNKMVNDKSSIYLGKGFIDTFKFTPPSDIDDLVLNMLVLTLFAFLFYHFLNIVVYMAEDLIGGPQAQALVSTTPTGIVDWAAGKMTDKAMEKYGKYTSEKEEKNNAPGDDPGDGGDAPSAPPDPGAK